MEGQPLDGAPTLTRATTVLEARETAYTLSVSVVTHTSWSSGDTRPIHGVPFTTIESTRAPVSTLTTLTCPANRLAT